MKRNEMIGYKESFISIINNFFKEIFEKKEQQINCIQKKVEDKNQQEVKKDEFIEDIKVDIKQVNFVIEKKKFLKEIDGNENILNMLSIDRLKKLEEYYDNIIEENNRTIENLKKLT